MIEPSETNSSPQKPTSRWRCPPPLCAAASDVVVAMPCPSLVGASFTYRYPTLGPEHIKTDSNPGQDVGRGAARAAPRPAFCPGDQKENCWICVPPGPYVQAVRVAGSSWMEGSCTPCSMM